MKTSLFVLALLFGSALTLSKLDQPCRVKHGKVQ
jgi:cathepsin X